MQHVIQASHAGPKVGFVCLLCEFASLVWYRLGSISATPHCLQFTGRLSFLYPEGKVSLPLCWRGRQGVSLLSKVTQLHLSRGLAVPYCLGTPVWHWCQRLAGWVLLQLSLLARDPVFVDRMVDIFNLSVLICDIDTMVFAYKDMAV